MMCAQGLTAFSAIAPEQRTKSATTRTTHSLDALQSSIDSDRALRSARQRRLQIAYSDALLSQRAVELGRAAEELQAAASGN